MNHLQEKILATLQTNNGIMEIWQLARKAGYLKDIIREVEDLKKAGLVSIRGVDISLTSRAPTMKNHNPISRVMKEYLRYRNEISFRSDEFDQLAVLPKGVERKLSVMISQDDLRNRDVLCLGDDDLFSLACSLTGLPKSVTVIDIDKDVIEFLDSVSPDLPIPIKVAKVNLVKGVPKNMQKKYDVFITEPPDTVAGMQLFLSRGMQFLRPKTGVFYAGMTEVTLNKKQWHAVEKLIIQSGMTITNIFQDFQEYEILGDELKWQGFSKLPSWVNKPAKKPWFVSALFRAESASAIKPVAVKLKNKKDLITSLMS